MPATTSTSSRDAFWLPVCSTGTTHRPAPSKGAGTSQALARQVRPLAQLALVEHLGREPTDRRREPPRLRQEDATLRRHRLRAADDVLQRRDVHAVGMTALLRLLELLRIAEQHKAVGGLRDGEDVRQRHLPRLVDEQHVDTRGGLVGRPEPRGATEHVDVARLQRVDRLAVRPVPRNALARLVIVLALASERDAHAALSGLRTHGLQQVDDDLVAAGGDPDLLAQP